MHAHFRTLLIGATVTNQPVNRLETPVMFHQVPREVVDQHGVTGAITQISKVTRSADDASAKMPLPQTIDNDSSRKRVGFRRDPIGQNFAASTRRPTFERIQLELSRFGLAGKSSREARFDRSQRGIPITSIERIGCRDARFKGRAK